MNLPNFNTARYTAAMTEEGPPLKRRRLSSTDDAQSMDDQKMPSQVVEIAAWEQEQAKEQQVGIQSYVNNHTKTFTGTLKSRYSDFLVNEILLNGEVVHLRSTNAPKTTSTINGHESTPTISNGATNDTHSGTKAASPSVEAPNIEVSIVPKVATEEAKHTTSASKPSHVPNSELPDVSLEQRSKLAELLNPQAAEEICDMYDTLKSDPTKKSLIAPVKSEFTTDRAMRSQIHQFIRETFSSRINSSTDKEGILILSAKQGNRGKNQSSNQNRGQRRDKTEWQDRGGEYLHFTLYKENKDTMEAMSYLIKQLKSNPKSFQFAGTKDRRAITSQRCSAYRIEAHRMAQQNRQLRNAKVGDFAYYPHGLELGDLAGNEFTITLRDCSLVGDGDGPGLDTLKQDMEQRMKSLHEQGYLNYFGQQRFGTFSLRTDIIGRYILKEDFKGACDAILHYLPESVEAAENEPDSMIGQDDQKRALAIHTWRTRNTINEALDILPRKFSAEAQVMRHLTKRATDFLGALLTIQRNLRNMYVHAYQSLIWNMAASKRLELYGTSVTPGDLVLVKEHKDKEMAIEITPTIDADGEQIIEPSGDDRAAELDDIFERARVLTEAEIKSGAYSIFDVVLPQPGYDVLYPENKIGEFYETFMASEEGGQLNPHSMRRKQRDFSLSGAYRKILTRIGEEYAVSVHRYSRNEEQFVKTDLEVLHSQDQTDSKISDTSETGSKLAVVLKFKLGSSQYATMALRELSKGGIVPYKTDFHGGR